MSPVEAWTLQLPHDNHLCRLGGGYLFRENYHAKFNTPQYYVTLIRLRYVYVNQRKRQFTT